MKSDTKIIKPKSGQIVRDPHTMAILPETGTAVSWTGPQGKFWKRRLRDGDIEIVEPEQIIESKYQKKFKEEK